MLVPCEIVGFIKDPHPGFNRSFPQPAYLGLTCHAGPVSHGIQIADHDQVRLAVLRRQLAQLFFHFPNLAKHLPAVAIVRLGGTAVSMEEKEVIELIAESYGDQSPGSKVDVARLKRPALSEDDLAELASAPSDEQFQPELAF